MGNTEKRTKSQEKVKNNFTIKSREHIATGKITNLLIMRHICCVVGITWENFEREP